MFHTWLDVALSLEEMGVLAGCLDKPGEPGKTTVELEKRGFLRRDQVGGGKVGFKLTEVGAELAETCASALVMRPLPNYGHLMPLEEFAGCVEAGVFIDYDGHGEYATADEVSGIVVKPSTFVLKEVDLKLTHVLWYNK